MKDFGKTYSVYFYTLIDSKGQWEEQNKKVVVNVGLSTNPCKALRDKQSIEKYKSINILLIKETTQENYKYLIENIEEVRANKSWFYFEPLADMIKKKCEETKFVPYSLKSHKKRTSAVEEVLGTLPL